MRADLIAEGISYSVCGSGPPVFFVHGNSSSKQCFQKQMASSLSRRFRLVAIDLLGHGQSAHASHSEPPSYTLKGWADAVIGAASALDVSDAVFVGHSLGGHVLLEAAPSLPEAKGFVLFGAPPLGKPPSNHAFLADPAGAAFIKPELSDAEIDSWGGACVAQSSKRLSNFSAHVRQADSRVRSSVAACLEHLLFHDELSILADMEVPVALLHGTEDRFVNARYLDELNVPTLWRGAVQRIEGAGHYPQWEKPRIFNDLLAAFVEDTSIHGS